VERGVERHSDVVPRSRSKPYVLSTAEHVVLKAVEQLEILRAAMWCFVAGQ